MTQITGEHESNHKVMKLILTSLKSEEKHKSNYACIKSKNHVLSLENSNVILVISLGLKK